MTTTPSDLPGGRPPGPRSRAAGPMAKTAIVSGAPSPGPGDDLLVTRRWTGRPDRKNRELIVPPDGSDVRGPAGPGWPQEAGPVHPRAGIASAAGTRLAAILLGAACVAWTATPLVHKGLAQLALVIAIIAVVAGALRLAFADIPQPEDQFFLPGYLQAWLTFLALLRTVPWEETAVVAILWLEVQHSAPALAHGGPRRGPAGLPAHHAHRRVGRGGGPAAPPPRETPDRRRLPARPGRRLRDDPDDGSGRGLGDPPRPGGRRGHRRHGPGPPRLNPSPASIRRPA